MALEPREQRKWDSLQDQGQSHIDRILAGKSTEADLAALSRLLAEQHELAGQIFDQGVEDAVQTANAIVQKMDEERQAKGKRALSEKAQNRLFEKTFRDVMSAAVEDILGQVHDEFEGQSRDIRNKVNEALDRIRNFTPQQPERQPAPGEVMAAREQRSLLDRLMRSNRPANEAVGEERRSLLDRMLGRRRGDAESSERRTVLQVIREAATSAKDKISALYDRVRGRNDDNDEERRATIWMRKLRAIFDPLKSAASKMKKGAGWVGNLLNSIGKPLLFALMSPKLLESISDAVSKYLSFDQISSYVNTMWEDSKKLGSDALDTVVDKVKSFFGFSKDKGKNASPAAKTASPSLSAARPVASTSLRKDITAADAQRELPRRKQQLEAAQREYEAAQAAYKANPTDANKKRLDQAKTSLDRAQVYMVQFTERANEGKTVTAPAVTAEVPKEQAKAAVAGTAPGEVAAPTPMVPTAADIPQQTSPVAPSAVFNRSSASPKATEVIGDMPKYTLGKAIESTDQQDLDTQKEADKAAAIAQIGIGSFGFDSNDSSMNILNLGMLS
jgi:hypothetical protein